MRRPRRISAQRPEPWTYASIVRDKQGKEWAALSVWVDAKSVGKFERWLKEASAYLKRGKKK